MTAPEQHSPPVYACAAGAVLHAHAADTLEPAVLLHTFLPPGAAEQMDSGEARVDVSGDGPGAATVTVRVLAEGRSLSWQLPIAPFVAALPGQLGDDGRMVLLAVVDAEPDPGFWASPVDCERLAAELQLPVADLAEALRGRLTRWLADDLEGLLHDDAHDRAVDRSPAQTLADAVLAAYRGDLAATQRTTGLVRALEFGPDEFTGELAGRLCAALTVALQDAGPADVDALLQETGPFETEVLRLLTELPAGLQAVPAAQRPETAMQHLLAGADRDETVRAAVTVVARLARQRFGGDLPDEQVLRRLSMVDDAGLARVARLWVDLAAATAAPPGGDAAVVAGLAQRVVAEGAPGSAWLRDTAGTLSALALEAAGRSADRVSTPLQSVRELLAGDSAEFDVPTATTAVAACLALARFVRPRAGIGPVRWLQAPVPAAAQAVSTALLDGLDREVVVDLLSELLDDDVEGPDLLDGLVCATAQLLVHLDPHADPTLRQGQVAEMLEAVPGGPRGARWLLAACLREAPVHDPAAADLGPLLPREAAVDPDKAAVRAGRLGMLRGGLQCLDALAAGLADETQVSREELLGLVLPSALVEHDLLRRSV